MTEPVKRCPGCYISFTGWWCDNCDAWPCTCPDDAEEQLEPTLAEAVTGLAEAYDQLAVGTLSAAPGDLVASERAAILAQVSRDLIKTVEKFGPDVEQTPEK